MGIHVLATYVPKSGHEAELSDLMATHVPNLRRLGLATDRSSQVLRAPDGTLVELFEWIDRAAIDSAHTNREVLAMWAEFDACSTYGTLADLPNASTMFAEFELLGSY